MAPAPVGRKRYMQTNGGGGGGAGRGGRSDPHIFTQ